MAGMDVGSVFVRVGALFEDKDFEKYDRAVLEAEKKGPVKVPLGADVDRSGFDKFDRAVAAADRQKATATLKADVDTRGFAAFKAGVRDSDSALGKLTQRMRDANTGTTFFSRALGAIKWPAMIAGAGMAATAISSLLGGVTALVGGLAPLSGALAAYPTMALAVKQAMGTVQLAFMGVEGGAEKITKALQKPTPEAKRLADTIGSFAPQIRDLQRTAQRGLLPGVEQGLKSASRNFGPLRTVIDGTAKALGRLAEQAGKQIGSASWGRDIEIVGKSNTVIIERLGRAGLHLADAFRHVLVAAGPLTRWMASVVEGWGKQAEGAAKAGRETGKLAGFFEKTRRTMERVGSIAGHVAKAFWEIGKAGAPLGRTILKDLDKVAASFERWTKSASGKNQIADYFKGVKAPLYAVAGLIADVTKTFLRLGSAPEGRNGFLLMVKAIRKDLLPVLEDVIQSTTAAFGPALIKLITNVLRILGQLAGTSGPLTGFVRLLGSAAGALANLLEGNAGLKNMVVFIGGLAAVAKTVQFLAMISGLKTVIDLYKSLKTAAIAAGIAQGAAGAGGAAAGAGGLFGGAAAGAGAAAGFKGLMGKLAPIAKRAGFVGLGLSAVSGIMEAFKSPAAGTGVGGRLQNLFSGATMGLIPKAEEKGRAISNKLLDPMMKMMARLKAAKDPAGLAKFANDARGAGDRLAKAFDNPRLRKEFDQLADAAERSGRRITNALNLKQASRLTTLALRALEGAAKHSLRQVRNVVDFNMGAIRELMKKDPAAGRKAAEGQFRGLVRALKTLLNDGKITASQYLKEIARQAAIHSKGSRQSIATNFGRAANAIKTAMREGRVSVDEGNKAIDRLMRASLRKLGFSIGEMKRLMASGITAADVAAGKIDLQNALQRGPQGLPTGSDSDPGERPGRRPGWFGGLVTRGGIERGYVSGGMVRDPRDTVPAWLAPGEFVMTQAATRRVGASALTALNRAGGMAKGGVVGPEFALADPLDKERKKTEPIVKKVRDLLGTIPKEGVKHAEATSEGVGDELTSGGKKWNTGIKKTTGAIVDKFDDLKTDSVKSTTSMVGAVERKFGDLKKNAGKLAGDLGRTVSSKFDGVKKDATKYTTQMFNAVQNRFEDTKRGATRQSQMMQKSVGGNFDGMRKEALKHTRAVAKNTGDGMADAKRTGAREAKALRGAVAGSYGSMDQAVYKGIVYVRRATSKALKGLGGGELKFTVDAPKGLARGGIVKADSGGWVGSEGERGADSELYLLGRGEAVLNRHQQEVVNSMLGNFGVGLNDVIGQIDRPHYAARGKAPKRAAGGLVQALGPYTIPPIQYEPNHAGGNSHLHLSMTSVAVAKKLAAAMQKMGWSISENPWAGGVTVTHQDQGHYTGSAFDANTGQDETRAQVAAVAELLRTGKYGNGSFAGPGGATWDTLKKMVVGGPAGPLKDMAQAAINKVTGQANKFGQKKADAMSSTYGGAGGFAGGGNAAKNRELGIRMAKARGWGGAEFRALDFLWGTGESGWDHHADNPGSTAYGIPQALGSAHPETTTAEWRNSPAMQIGWGLDYIASNYGSPSKALAFWHAQSPHWYARGGIAGMKRVGSRLVQAAARGKHAYPFRRKHGVIGRPHQGTHTLGNWQSDNAVDISAPKGSDVLAVEDARVSKLGGSWRGGASQFDGYQLTLDAPGTDAWFYTHLMRHAVGTGDRVKKGQQIGRSGAANSVDHLHLGRSPGLSGTAVLGFPLFDRSRDKDERKKEAKQKRDKVRRSKAITAGAKVMVEPPGTWLLGDNGMPYYDYAKKGLADWRPTLGQLMNSDIPGSYIKGSRDDPKRKPGPIGYVGDAIAQGTLGAFRNMMSRRVYGDTKKGRTSTSSLSALRGMKDQNFDGYVFDVGTKDASASEMLGNVKAADRITGDRPVVVPTLHGGPKRKEKNQALRAWERSHEDRKVDDLHVLDWSSGPKGTKDEKGSELTPRGYRSRAGAVAKRMRSAIRMGDTRKKGRGLVTDIYSPKGRPLTAAGGKKGKTGVKVKPKPPKAVNRFSRSLRATMGSFDGNWGIDAVEAKLTDLDRQYQNEERSYEVNWGIEEFVIPAVMKPDGTKAEDPKLDVEALKRKQASLARLMELRRQMVRVTEGAVEMVQKTIDKLREGIKKLRAARDAAKGKDRPYNELIKEYNRSIAGLKTTKKGLYQMRFDERADLKELERESAQFSDSAQGSLLAAAIAEANPPADPPDPGGGDTGGASGLDPAEVAAQARAMFASFLGARQSLFSGSGSNFYAGPPGLDPGTVSAGFRQFGAFGQVAGGDNAEGVGGGYSAVNRAGGGPKVEVTQHFAAPPLDAHTWTADLKYEVLAQL